MAATARPSHERPMLVVLPDADAVGPALVALLSAPAVRAYALPAVWDLDLGGLDPLAGLPDVRRLDLENLPRVVDWLRRAATPARLDEHTRRVWAETSDSVREFFLRRSAVATFAALLRLGRSSRGFDPPPSFVEDRKRGARFEVVYRLAREAGAPPSPLAPEEEASLVVYPFDVHAPASRAEAGLPPSAREAVVEAFAYEAGRARHRAFLADAARSVGGRVVDPPAP
jgi:hypothetical protein